MATKYPAHRTRKYRVWTYDVWGNARDGFDVNDRRSQGTVEIRCKVEVCNEGTDREFASWSPSDRQLSRACGFRGVSWDMSSDPDDTVSCEVSRNGRPVGEVEFIGWVE
jgi:hypothetical protein